MNRMKWVALVVVLGAVGCGHAKEGDTCNSGDVQCEDKHTLLECETTGTYRAIPCPGPEGCVFDNNAATPILVCDLTGTVPGDECQSSYQGFVGCTDAHNALECNGAHWGAVACPTSCQSGETGVDVPQSLGSCS